MTDRLGAAVAELVAAIRAEATAQAPPMPSVPRLLSVEQAAEALGLARSNTYKLIQSGQLRTVKVGGRRLVSEAALAEFIETIEATAVPSTAAGPSPVGPNHAQIGARTIAKRGRGRNGGRSVP